VTPALVGVAVLLAFAAAWQFLAERSEATVTVARRLVARFGSRRIQALAEGAMGLGLAARLDRAGMTGRLGPGAILGSKVLGCVVGAGCAVIAVPALPGRLGLVAAPLMAVAGFLAPDALLERAARLRRARIVAALPDAVDILAVGAAAGRAPAAVVRDLAGRGGGPLAGELAAAVADLDCGTGQRAALEALCQRVGGSEFAALAAALERSRRYGSPLAAQLQAQASALRADARRRTEEAASRAAPKIQLVVALVLVPSVLLMILAAIVAHADALLGGL